MTVAGFLIGFINCIALAVILVLIGAIVAWVMGALGWAVPWNIHRLYLALVALIFLICFVSLLFGSPMVHIFGHA